MDHSMKTLLSIVTKALLILASLAGWLWLCFAFPEEITGFFESLGIFLFVLFIALFVLGQLLMFIADMFPSKPPSKPTSDQPHPISEPRIPNSTHRPASLTPLLLALALGWWFGGGPGDGGDDS